MKSNKNYLRFFVRNVVVLAIASLLLILLSNNGELDFLISGKFFDNTTHNFPLQYSPLLVSVGHTFLKDVTALFLITGILLSIASYRVSALQTMRFPLINFCLMAAASALSISYLKSTSIHACPWDLQMYGGQAAWFPLFAENLLTSVPGHCWPGGHASGGFALVAGHFAFRDYRPRWAKAFLISSLVFGFVMGFVQIMRGAHFLSHNLWTLWFVWAICFVYDALFRLISFKHKKSVISKLAEQT